MKKAKTLKPLYFWLIYAGVIVACILIDQLTKHFIEIAVANNGGSIRVLGNWLTLIWTLNDGATGGIFKGMQGRNILFFIMTLVGLPVFGYMLWRSRTKSAWGQVAFAFMIGGTIGNAIDRLFLVEEGGEFFSGAVRDFVCVKNFFGIFNMADSFLVVGVILALLAILFFDPDSVVAMFMNERKKKQTVTNETSQENIAENEQNDTAENVDDILKETSPTENNDEDD